MLKKLLSAIFLAPLALIAQDYDMKNYDWESETAFQELSEEEKDEPSVILKDKRVFEYMIVETSGRSGLVIYETRHKIVRVNNDKGIEKYNKFFLPMANVMEVVDLKARTTTKEGKVIELDESNLKELENVEDYGYFKIFAIDGLEPESTFEILYTVKKGLSFFGRQFYQGSTIVKDASIEIITPEHLNFIAKAYNGFPELEETKEGEKRYLKSEIDQIPVLEDELFSMTDAYRMRIDYKFSHNNLRGSSESFTWNEAAQRFYEIVYEPLAKYEKKFAKEVSKIELDGKSELEKIKAIENHVKNNYAYQEDNPDGGDLGVVFKKQVVNSSGVTRLLAGLFMNAGVKHELVLTCDRTDVKFDKDFQTWNFLDEFLFYLPVADDYIAPDKYETRLGAFPVEWANNYGLFIKLLEIGETTTGIGEVRWIDCCGVESQFDNLDMSISFPEDMAHANISLKREFAGHNAMFIQPYYDLIPESEQGPILEDLLNFMGEDAELTSKSIEHTDRNVSPAEQPMKLAGEMTVASVLEKAGPNYLFKIGQVIGPQSEMYQEKERVTEVELTYPHKYDRIIRFTVPDGYTVSGMDALNMDIKYGDDEGDSMGFISSYTQEGNTVTVTVIEYYNRFNYPLEQFEEFRKVINAAADFNKIVLVFEKQG